MKLTDKQEERLHEILKHAFGACECGWDDKKCLFNRITEKDGADAWGLVVKEIEKL